MKKTRNDLEAVLSALRYLTEKTEKIISRLEVLEALSGQHESVNIKVNPRRRNLTKRSRKTTAGDTVLGIIRRSRKGVDTATIRQKTGFGDKKIWNIVNRLKIRKQIKSERKGIYVKL